MAFHMPFQGVPAVSQGISEPLKDFFVRRRMIARKRYDRVRLFREPTCSPATSYRRPA
jgi:hypothetical protein